MISYLWEKYFGSVLSIIYWFIFLAIPLTCIANTTKNDINKSIRDSVNDIDVKLQKESVKHKKCASLFLGIYHLIHDGNFSWSTLIKWIIVGFSPIEIVRIHEDINKVQIFYRNNLGSILHLSIFSLIILDLVYTLMAIRMKCNPKEGQKYERYLKSPSHFLCIDHRLLITIGIFLGSFVLLIIGVFVSKCPLLGPNGGFIVMLIIILIIWIIYYECKYKKITK